MSESQPHRPDRKFLRKLAGAAIVAGAATVVILGYVQGRNERSIDAEDDAPVKAPLRVSIVGGEPTITLDATALQSSNIGTMRLQSTADAQEFRAYGTVLDLQTLTDLSNSYATINAQLQTAQARLDASRLAFERAQRLNQDQQNVSAAQVQASESAFRVDQANLAAAEAQLQNVTSSALQQWGPVVGRAIVDRSPLLLRLMQREDVLVQVTLPPGEALAEPPKVAVAQAGNAIHAKLQFLSLAPRTDARIQGISFLYIAPAGSGLLPGMNVEAILPSGKEARATLVPASAVVWSDGKAWAYFRTGDQTFARREVATDTPAPDGGYMVRGMPNNSEVVSRGAQLLLSEEFRSRIEVGE